MDCDFGNRPFHVNRSNFGALDVEYKITLLTAVRSLYGTNNTSCVKAHLVPYWELFTAAYALVGVGGLLGNLAMVHQMARHTHFSRLVNFLLLNLCLSDIVKCTAILPLSFAAMLGSVWPGGAVGETACHYFPIIQNYTIVVSVVSHLLVALDRYLLVVHDSGRSHHSRKAYATILIGIWVGCFCVLLPLKAYMQFFQLSTYFGPSFSGWGYCTVKFSSNIREVNVAQFAGLFTLPLIISAYFHSRSRNELRRQTMAARPGRIELQVPGDRHRSTSSASSVFLDAIERERGQAELDLTASRCLATLTLLFGLCWSPLQCLLLIFYIVPETQDSVLVIDILFLLFALIGFCCTLTGPLYLFVQPQPFHSLLNRSLVIIRHMSAARPSPRPLHHRQGSAEAPVGNGSAARV